MNKGDLFEVRRALMLHDTDMSRALSALDTLAVGFDQACSDGNAKVFTEGDAKYCLDAIARSAPLLTEALCRWVPAAGRRTLADSLIHCADVHYLQQKALLPVDLSGLDAEASMCVADRLCIGHATPALALAWVLALHRYFPDSAATEAKALELVRLYATEYPASSLALTANRDSPLAQTPLALRLHEDLSWHQTYLDSLPKLTEFALPPEHRLLLVSLRRQRNRTMTKISTERSLLASLMNVSHFKYANRTAVEVHALDSTQEIEMKMMPLSMSVELPLSALVDPMTELLRRHEFMKAKQ